MLLLKKFWQLKRIRVIDGQRSPLTSHTLNPVPFLLVDPEHRWQLAPVEGAGLANIGTSILALCGLTPPEDFEPALVTPVP